MRQVLRYIATLYGLQIVASGLAYLLFDLRYLSIPLSICFLGLVWWTGHSLPDLLDGDRYPSTRQRRWVHGPVAVLAGLIWQIPGLLAPGRFLGEKLGLAPYDGMSDLYDFVCEAWHLTLMPLLTTIPATTADGYHAGYYFALLATSPTLILLLLIAALWPRRKRRHGW